MLNIASFAPLLLTSGSNKTSQPKMVVTDSTMCDGLLAATVPEPQKQITLFGFCNAKQESSSSPFCHVVNGSFDQIATSASKAIACCPLSWNYKEPHFLSALCGSSSYSCLLTQKFGFSFMMSANTAPPRKTALHKDKHLRWQQLLSEGRHLEGKSLNSLHCQQASSSPFRSDNGPACWQTRSVACMTCSVHGVTCVLPSGWILNLELQPSETCFVALQHDRALTAVF